MDELLKYVSDNNVTSPFVLALAYNDYVLKYNKICYDKNGNTWYNTLTNTEFTLEDIRHDLIHNIPKMLSTSLDGRFINLRKLASSGVLYKEFVNCIKNGYIY